MYDLGDCFRIETNLDREGKIKSHFFVIILKSTGGRIVIVNFDKTRGFPKFDKTVIIQAGEWGDHISEESFVNYDQSELTSVDELIEKVKSGIAHYVGIVDESLLQRICDGVLRSQLSPYEVREVFLDKLYGNL